MHKLLHHTEVTQLFFVYPGWSFGAVLDSSISLLKIGRNKKG